MASSRPDANELCSYQIVRERMDQENSLITQRLNWLITSQCFLFTAYSLTLPQERDAASAAALRGQLRFLIPLVAISIGLLIYLAIIAGWRALAYDRSLLLPILEWLKARGFPPVKSPCCRYWIGLMAPLLVPVLLFLAWLFLLLLPGARPPG